jgi:galactokinase/galacturonokinase
VDTGYNQRVLECQRAAAKVLQASGRRLPGLPRLRDISLPEFQAQSEKLPENERRRAEHYFGEMDRVRRGVAAWRAGRLDDLGRAVTETGESSIHNYECGSPELIALFELLAAESGVYGARFSGAGFRGYCMALVDPSRADAIVASVAGRYLERFPNYRPAFHAHLCRPSDGARVLRDETWG